MEQPTKKKRGCRYWFNLLAVGLVGGLVLFQVGYIVVWVWATSSPARTPVCCVTPADLGVEYEEVALISDDGLTLVGWYIPSQNGAAVILLHGYGANRMEMLKRASILAEKGYGLLLYDQRASGESQGKVRSAGWADVKDVPAALTFLLEREDVDPDRIGILGFSVGGQIALRAAAERDELQAVVAEEPGFAALEDLYPLTSPYERWIALNYRFGFKGLEWRTGVRAPSGVAEGIADIAPRPLLLIAAGSPEEPGHRLIRTFYERAGEPKTLWEVPEASHGGVPVVRPDEYEQRIVTFFNGALLAEPR